MSAATEQLTNEIARAIKHARLESELTLSEIVGVLQIESMKLTIEAAADALDDQDDEDDDLQEGLPDVDNEGEPE